MKEKSRKVGLLVKRHGLLTVLGLGCSFLGTSAYGGAGPAVPAAPGIDLSGIKQDARLIANSPNANNAWDFDGNGALVNSQTIANLLRIGENDAIKIVGTPEAGNTVQVIFDQSYAPGDANNGPFWCDNVADGISREVYESLTAEAPNSQVPAEWAAFNATIRGALTSMMLALDAGGAKKYALAIAAAVNEAKAGIGGITPAQTASYDALAGIFGNIGQNSAEAGIRIDTKIRNDLETAWGNLVLAAAAAGGGRQIQDNDGGGIGNVNADQEGGGALAHLVNQAAATVLDATDAEIQAAIRDVNEIFQAIARVPDGSDHANVRACMAAAENLVAQINVLRTLSDECAEDSNLPKSIAGMLEKLSEMGGTAFGGNLALLGSAGVLDANVLGDDLMSQLNDSAFWQAFRLSENGTPLAPFMISPCAATDPRTPPRSFVLQITQDSLKSLLRLSNDGGSGRSVMIDAANMRENEEVAIVFDAKSQDNHQQVMLGDITYNNLTKDSRLLLISKISQNAYIDNIIAHNKRGGLFEYLTVQIAVQDENYNIVSQLVREADPVMVKKLILGIPETEKPRIEDGDVLQESPLKNFYGNYVIKNGSLYVKEGIDVLSDSRLEFIEKSDKPDDNNFNDKCGYCMTNGDITISKGTTLTLGLKSILPVMDGSIPLVGSGAGKMGVLQVEGNLAFKKICVLAKENNDVVNENANVSFRIVQYGGSYHNYIVIDGGEKNNPCEIKLNGCTLTLADTDEDGGRVLEKINTQDSSQLILVKEKSFAKIIGSDDPGNPGCLALDLHGDHAKKVALIRLENDASIVLDPLNIEAGEHDAIIAGNNNKILFLDTDPVTLKGNITGGSGLTFVFMLSNDEKKSKADTIFDWKSGKLAIPEGAKVNFAIDTAFDSIRGGRKRMQDFLNAYKQAHPAIKFINLADNAANKVAILAALSLEITGHLIDGVKLAKDDDGNIIVNLENAATASLEKLLGGVAPYLSDSFAKLLENAYENGNQTVIERGILEYLNLNEARVLPAFSKTTTEEKNRMTLTLINSIRETVYSKLGGEFFGDKHYNVWASGFGNAARNGSLSSYKMNCDIFGFATGIDWRVNNNLLVGVLGGYGKAKAKYKGEIHLENKPSKCNLESYFGGIYGMWDEFIEDISVKFSLMAGHGKYNEQYSLPLIDTVGIAPISSSPEGHWISGNIDCTYKHWNFYGLNVGPWVSLSVATIHQKSKTERLENDAPPTDSHFERKIAAADRRSIETTIGVAADYDLSMGILELAIGYKHEFRNLKKGKVSLYETYNNSNYKIVAHGDGPAEFFEFDPFNVSTGKDSFVGKVSWNMQFGDFGLTLGGHTQLGNHFKDIAGSITASYSF